jgi:hypothetical protein
VRDLLHGRVCSCNSTVAEYVSSLLDALVVYDRFEKGDATRPIRMHTENFLLTFAVPSEVTSENIRYKKLPKTREICT